MITIRPGTTQDIGIIQDIAEATWWPTYSPLLTEIQIRYMLDAIYSIEALTKALEKDDQNFLILEDENGAQGFASYGSRKENPAITKLHKLYVLPGNQKKGYGKLLIDQVIAKARLNKSNQLDLNVNRFNKAKTFYERIGFKVIREEDVPIGPYWMNDYVMSLKLVPS